jgi:NAD(P)-dependent dehydrogenase (short-subunit alcohol dehydrogenase family)
MGRLDGKSAVITGGASGIGEAAVRLFAEEGAGVLIADIQDEKGRHLAEELGSNAVYQHTDVSRESDVKVAVEKALSDFGRLDCMFNNAGIPGFSGPIEETPVEAFDQTLGVHLRGVFLGIKHAARIMKRQQSGSIINTGSVAGLHTGYGPHAYSTAKAGIIHLTRLAAVELGESGVRVNCICPGGITTAIFGVAFGLSPEEADGKVDLLKEPFSQLQPLRRPGDPRDIAQAALWLASDDSSFVNGHALVVDGGLTCGRGWSASSQSFADLAAAMGLDSSMQAE